MRSARRPRTALRDFECASFKGPSGVAGKRCVAPDTIMKTAECGKP
jgi:hypothetical protein